MQRSLCRLTSFFRLLISCSVAEICSVKVQSRSQKAVLPQPVGVNAREFRPNFSTSSHKWIVSKFGWDPFSDVRDWTSKKERWKKERRKKEKEKNTAVKYKPFGIAMPCGLDIRWRLMSISRRHCCIRACAVRRSVCTVGCRVLTVISNDFFTKWLKVVSSCLLQYKPVCVTNFDKLCRKTLQSLLVFWYSYSSAVSVACDVYAC